MDQEATTVQMSPEKASILSQFDERNIEDQINRIANIGVDPNGGVTRLAYTFEESMASSWLADVAFRMGFEVSEDNVGNLFFSYRSPNKKEIGALERTKLPEAPKSFDGEIIEPFYNVLITGSHLDTVPMGGNYDGVAGVVSSLEAVRSIKESGVPTKKDLVVAVWRGEESSRFGKAYLGSEAAFGTLDSEMLQRKEKNGEVTLEQAILTEGGNPYVINSGEASLTKDSFSNSLGLHIEQASVLENAGVDIGLVTSIRGTNRFEIQYSGKPLYKFLSQKQRTPVFKMIFKGQYDHSGGTPMDARKDANVALIQFLSELNYRKAMYQEKGHELQFDYEMQTDPDKGSINKVSGYAEVTFNVGPYDVQLWGDTLLREIREIWDSVNSNHDVEVEMEILPESGYTRGNNDVAVPEYDQIMRGETEEAMWGLHGCHDSTVAMVELLQYVNDMRARYEDSSNYHDSDFVYTYPEIFTTHGDDGEVYCKVNFDVRSNNATTIELLRREIMTASSCMALDYGVGDENKHISYSEPVPELDPHLIELMEENAKLLGLTTMRMPSGAGHDSAVLAKIKAGQEGGNGVGMIFVPSVKGISHHPDEYTPHDKIANGSKLIALTYHDLAA